MWNIHPNSQRVILHLLFPDFIRDLTIAAEVLKTIPPQSQKPKCREGNGFFKATPSAKANLEVKSELFPPGHLSPHLQPLDYVLRGNLCLKRPQCLSSYCDWPNTGRCHVILMQKRATILSKKKYNSFQQKFAE